MSIIVDNFGRTDYPGRFEHGNDDLFTLFDENPDEALYAAFIWDTEARLRVADKPSRMLDPDIQWVVADVFCTCTANFAASYFRGLTRTLVLYGDCMRLNLQYLWPYCSACVNDLVLPSKADFGDEDVQFSDWQPGLVKAYDLARIDIERLAFRLRTNRKIDVVDLEYSQPKAPKEWAADYGVTVRTFTNWCNDDKLRYKKLTTKSYQVAILDLPTKPPSGN